MNQVSSDDLAAEFEWFEQLNKDTWRLAGTWPRVELGQCRPVVNLRQYSAIADTGVILLNAGCMPRGGGAE
jgi:hypothetical protein